MPIGVDVKTGRIAAPSNPSVPSGRVVVVGATQRGTAKPTVVRSLTQFTQNFGERSLSTSYVYDTLEVFFNEGGGEAVIARVLGAAATADFGILKAPAVGEVPGEDIVRFTAREKGGTGDLYVTANPTQTEVQVRRLVGTAYVTLERFPGLGVEDILENFNDSEHVTAEYVGAGLADNSETVTGSVNLTGGLSDAENATADTYARSIATAIEYSPGAAIVAPGFFPSAPGAINALAVAADGHLFITGGQRGESFENFARADAEGESHDGPENVLAVAPWVRVPNGDRLKTVPPEGFVAGVRARAHSETGFWKSPAGADSAARFVSGVAWPNGEDSTTLNPNSIERRIWANPILDRRGQITLADYRSAWASVSEPLQAQEIDTIANIRAQVKSALEQYMFRTIDGRGQLFADVAGTVTGVLQPLSDENALYARLVDGEEVDPGYSVVCDLSNNTPESLANNILNVEIGVRLSPVARDIRVTLIQVPLSAAL